MSSFPVDSVTILYGSETGNAQDYAHYLGRKLRYNSLKPTVASLDSYPLKSLVTDTRFLIVICSTTGQGELPRNAKRFLNFLLRKKLPHDLLNHIHCTTFGLGDSSYPKFNYAIKKIHARLLQLGCKELSPRCESDEQAPEGIDGYYAEWERTLIAGLQKQFPALYSIDENVLLPPEYHVEVVGAENLEKSANLELTRHSLSVGQIVQNRRVTASDHFQDVRHLVIEAENGDLDYAPGDTLALYPHNDDHTVQLLLELQPQWLEIADRPLEIGPLEVEGGLIDAKCLTLRTLFTFHLDIMAIPRRSFFSLLYHFVDDATDDGQREREKLYEFSKIEESEDLYDYANRPRRLILETLLEFERNLIIPIHYVLDLFPTIKVRLFLIASRPSPKSVELVVAIVEYKTILRRIRRGLCTKWIKSLNTGDKVVYSVHRSNLSFLLPATPNPPVLMISPGTGVAPMKSLIEHVAGTSELHLFYGCRYRAKDYLFGDLWDNLEVEVYGCFSRDAGSEAKYVQDRLFQEKELVEELLLKKSAIVFVCGSSGNMPRQVRLTLAQILQDGGLGEAESHDYLLKMENSGRYIQETW